MRILPRAALVAAAAVLGAGAWGSTGASAQDVNNLCFQRCAFQFGWPEDQCADFCRRRPRGNVYGYIGSSGDQSRGKAGSCGVYHYWNGKTCADIRDKPATQ